MPKQRIRLWATALGIYLLCVPQAASGATVRLMTLDSLIQESNVVIYGRVLGSRSVWDSTTQTIWTQTEFAVLDATKGASPRTVLVTEPGGIIGDVGQLFPGVPRFEANQEVVLFLYHASGNRLRVMGLLQGVYHVEQDHTTGERLARPAIMQREKVYEDGNVKGSRLNSGSPAPRLAEFLFFIRQKASR